ncbi:MAG: hypothetical protein AAGJ81_15965 [Verrucomicrobiota bacterium]
MIRVPNEISFLPPTSEDEWWTTLTDKQRAHASILLNFMEIIATAPKISVGVQIAQLDPRNEWSSKRLKDLWREFRRTEGNWRVLVPKWSTPQGQPPAFIQEWKARCERHQRKSYDAWKQLIVDWVAWRRGDESKAIAGFRTPPPPAPGQNHPNGWSYGNLTRHMPEEHELVATRQGGSKHRSTYLPKVITTRADLLPGHFYMFDDVWHDLHVNLVGQQTSVRPIEIGVLDLFSGYRPLWLMKSLMRDEDGKRQGFLEVETLYLATATLRECGYRPEGTQLILEHATTAIRQEEIIRAIYDGTGGSVTIGTSGIANAAAIAGQYAGAGKGNPRFKAALESFHNLMHNRMDALMGQVGKNPEHSPEENYRLQLRNNHLLRALHYLADKGDSEAVRNLNFDLLEWHQFCQIAGSVYDRIHNDPDHNLEGWLAAGLTQTEWRLSTDHEFASLEDTDEEQRRLVVNYCQGRDGLTRARKMSRIEAWNHKRKGLRKLNPAAMANILVLHEKVGKERTVNDEGCFVFSDSQYGTGEYHFMGEAHGINGSLGISLKRREKYLTVWNPLIPDELHAFDGKGKYLGICPGRNRPSRADEEGIQRSLGEVRRVESQLLRGVSFRGKSLMEQRKADTEANIRLLDPTEREKLKSRERSKKLARSGGELSELDEPETQSIGEDYSLSELED